MKETRQFEEQSSKKRISLLKKFDIPVEHLDFKYVAECKDTKEVERILRILSSGEEGTYPELLKSTQERLYELNPKSSVLREEKPSIRSAEMNKSERDEIQHDLLDWIGKMEEKCHPSNDKNIFAHESDTTPTTSNVPIRGKETISQGAGQKAVKSGNDTFLKSSNTDRIKSWEYDKWDKFDVDAELTRLDVQDMKIKEWEQRIKPKLQNEQAKIELLMKNKDVEDATSSKRGTNTTNQTSMKEKMASFAFPRERNKNNFNAPGLPKSFIEELPMDKEPEQKKTPSTGNKRRVKVIIDDVNVGR